MSLRNSHYKTVIPRMQQLARRAIDLPVRRERGGVGGTVIVCSCTRRMGDFPCTSRQPTGTWPNLKQLISTNKINNHMTRWRRQQENNLRHGRTSKQSETKRELPRQKAEPGKGNKKIQESGKPLAGLLCLASLVGLPGSSAFHGSSLCDLLQQLRSTSRGEQPSVRASFFF